MKVRFGLVAGLLVAAVMARAEEPAEKPLPVPLPRYGQVAQKLVRLLPRAHLLQTPVNDAMSQKAWTNFLAQFDYDRSFFLQSDIAAFEPMRLQIDDALKGGEVSFPFEVYRVFRERVEQRYVFVTNLVEKGFAFDTDESYVWKRRELPWPEDLAAQDELWRKRIKNEVLAQRINRQLEAEEAEKKKEAVQFFRPDIDMEAFEVLRKEIDAALTGGRAGTPAGSVKLEAAGLGADWAKAAAWGTNVAAAVWMKGAEAALLTNGVPVAAWTNWVAAAQAAKRPVPSVEENVAKRYRQLLYAVRDMDEETIFQRYMTALTMAYDPHSEYMSPTRKEDFDIDMNLALFGIGAQLQSEDGMAKVMEVIAGGPAARDERPIRLVKDDKIIGVGQGDGEIEDIVHVPLKQAVRKIRGPKGSKVVLEVIPQSDPGGATTKLVDLIRDEVKLEAQAATGYVSRVTLADGKERKLGVVRLPAFYGSMDKRPGQEGYRSAALDVAREIAKLNTEGVEGLALDLRGNGGGSLREAIHLIGLFVRSGPAVQVRELRGIRELPIANLEPTMAFRRPVVVMIDRISASASEIVAGALQDYGRALVVGDSQTHGKGTVQTVVPLGDADFGALKVTTASFYRIDGASTQRNGVRSDIVIPSVLEGLDMGEGKLPGALPWTQIESALYMPVADVTNHVTELKALSAERLAKNAQYARHSALVRRTQEMSEKTEITLEETARRALIKAENEMRKAEEAEELGEKKSEPKDDVVLAETLNILSDLVTITGGAEILMETEGDLRARLLRLFGR